MKTIIYVDGYNLFYGCLKHSQDKWLDIYKLLFQRIVFAQDPSSELVAIKFFTADTRAAVATNGQASQQAQQHYHHALQRLYPSIIRVIKGYYSLEKANLLAYRKPPDKNDRVEVWKLEEKQTDVNIALEAYRDACKGDAEHLVFVSNDTDLAPALAAIREDFGNTPKVGVIIPVRSSPKQRPANKQLSEHANWTRRYITDVELAESHLPERIPTNKKPIVKPEYW